MQRDHGPSEAPTKPRVARYPPPNPATNVQDAPKLRWNLSRENRSFGVRATTHVIFDLAGLALYFFLEICNNVSSRRASITGIKKSSITGSSISFFQAFPCLSSSFISRGILLARARARAYSLFSSESLASLRLPPSPVRKGVGFLVHPVRRARGASDALLHPAGAMCHDAKPVGN